MEQTVSSLQSLISTQPADPYLSVFIPARNEAEMRLTRHLIERFGRAEVEQVVSGTGLVNIHHVTHDAPCAAVHDLTQHDAPASAALS